MFDEKRLWKEVKKYLDKARPGDLDHTLKVVELTKKILETERGNPDILIPAAYLHDLGYSGLFKEGEKQDKTNWHINLEEHMKRGKEIAIKILSKLGFPEKAIKRIAHIVSVHDDWYNQDDQEIGILIDADNLGKLGPEHVKVKYKNPREAIEWWEKEVPKRLKTKTGKSMYPKLIKKLKEEFNLQ